jgi:hypothetical protein
MLLKIGATYLADQVQANHPHKPSQPVGAKGKDFDTRRQDGSELDAKLPLRGSLLRDFTVNSGQQRPREYESTRLQGLGSPSPRLVDSLPTLKSRSAR